MLVRCGGRRVAGLVGMVIGGKVVVGVVSVVHCLAVGSNMRGLAMAGIMCIMAWTAVVVVVAMVAIVVVVGVSHAKRCKRVRLVAHSCFWKIRWVWIPT